MPDPFDLRLLGAAGERAGIGFVLVPMERVTIDDALRTGDLDFTLPAVKSCDRDDWAHFSAPYDTRTDVLFVAESAPALAGRGSALLLEALAKGLRIAVVRGEEHGTSVDALVAERSRTPQIVLTADDAESLAFLLAGRVDGFLAPRLAGMAALANRPGAGALVRQVEAPVAENSVHVAFSRARVGPETVDAFDRALASLRADGTEARLRSRSTAPVLVRLAAAADWMTWLERVGTVAFALTGVLLARKEGYSLLGALVLAALPAFGGGVVRDLMVGRRPIGVLQSAWPVGTVLATVLVSYLALKLFDAIERGPAAPIRSLAERLAAASALPFLNLVELTDAMGLATITVVGVVVAVQQGAEPLWLWGPLCAVIGGAGGGILRDVLRADSANPALRSSFYAEVAILWGLVLTGMVLWLGHEERPDLLRVAVAVTVAGAFLTRAAVVLLRLRSPRF